MLLPDALILQRTAVPKTVDNFPIWKRQWFSKVRCVNTYH